MKVILILVIAVTLMVAVESVNIRIENEMPHTPSTIKSDTAIRDMFFHWMKKHNKVYSSMNEFETRLANFKVNLAKIEKLSEKNPKANFSVNKFSDLTHTEFSGKFLMTDFQHSHHAGSRAKNYKTVVKSPYAVVDWRKKGFVNPVRDQGQCGSCWAFSATEEIETAWIMAGNSHVVLSEQQVVDCDTADGGCGGGNPSTAYEYVMSAGGIATDADYPYTAENGDCRSDVNKTVQISGYTFISQNADENVLIDAVAKKGPISICVDASTWMNYNGGILTDCPTDIDHCVQVVGLDVDTTDQSNPVPYYIIRNSWGTSWGIEGYIYVAQGSNLCGITNEATIVHI
ncbi:hypothetical protein CYY_000871 [Polysphondylium violaceum]|uniref:Uncharacterized protein n=1 Tax=Polysphondylium violaceum TaxID=133409 RepID=A0A8J4Q113_9MYCE|nr:hypothetical protein CYY_000871 [Polysphondylium violaceum]